MTYDEMLSIMEQFENMGLLYDTGNRQNGKIVFVFRWEPSPEMMDEHAPDYGVSSADSSRRVFSAWAIWQRVSALARWSRTSGAQGQTEA